MLHSEHPAVKDISQVVFRKAIPIWKSNIACQPCQPRGNLPSFIRNLWLPLVSVAWSLHINSTANLLCLFAVCCRRSQSSFRRDNFFATGSHLRFSSIIIPRIDGIRPFLFPSSSGEYVLHEKSISRHFPDGRSSSRIYDSQFIKPTIWSRRVP